MDPAGSMDWPPSPIWRGQYSITGSYVNPTSVFRQTWTLPSVGRWREFLNQLAVGGVKSKPFFRGASIWRGMSLFPKTQVLKDLSNDVSLVNEANNSHFARALVGDWGRAFHSIQSCLVNLRSLVGELRFS